MSELRTCCCGGCSVRTGTIVIAIVSLAGSLYNVFAYSSQMAILTTDPYNPTSLVQGPTFANKQYRDIVLELYNNNRTLMTIITCILLIGEAINAPFSALLLYAAVKNGPHRCLLPWIGYNALCTIISAVCAVLASFYLTTKLGGVFGFIMAFVLLLIYALYFYLIRVVYYYMKELQQVTVSFGGGMGVGVGQFDGVVGFVSNPLQMEGKTYRI